MTRTRKLLAVAALALVSLTSTSMFEKAHAAIGAVGNVHTVGCYYTGVGCI
jgi:hypothetical protein